MQSRASISGRPSPSGEVVGAARVFYFAKFLTVAVVILASFGLLSTSSTRYIGLAPL